MRKNVNEKMKTNGWVVKLGSSNIEIRQPKVIQIFLHQVLVGFDQFISIVFQILKLCFKFLYDITLTYI